MDNQLCRLSVEQHADQIMKILPRGRAWTRSRDSVPYKFWSAFAEMIKYVEDMACDLGDEFFCSTASATLDEWGKIYGVTAPLPLDRAAACVKPDYSEEYENTYRADICAKVASQGGSTTQYFEAVAESLNWVTDMRSVDNSNLHMAGRSMAGCTMVGPRGERTNLSGNVGYGSINPCDYGRAVDHPDATVWARGADRSDVQCAVPGAATGLAACCSPAGYFELPAVAATSVTRDSACRTDDDPLSIYETCFDDVHQPTRCDLSGSYLEYQGHANRLVIDVDTKETLRAHEENSAYVKYWPMAGCRMAGDPCMPTRTLDVEGFKTRLEDIVPAHIEMTTRMV